MRNPRTLLESSGNKPQRNGGISNTLTTQSSTTTPLSARSNTGDDIDIQILQQKKQQAEIKRCVSYLYYGLQQLLGVVYSLLLFSLRAHNSRLLLIDKLKDGCIISVSFYIITYLACGFLLYRTQQESELRENHPYFDTPLFMVGRESRFREICKTIVTARYSQSHVDSVTGQESKVKYKKLA